MSTRVGILARVFTFILTILACTVQQSAIATDTTSLATESSNKKGVLNFLVRLCQNPNPFNLTALDEIVGAKSKHQSYSYEYEEKLPTGIRSLRFWDEEPIPAGEIPDITVNLDNNKTFITPNELADMLLLGKDKQIATSVAYCTEVIYQMPWGALSIYKDINKDPSIIRVELFTTKRFKFHVSDRILEKASRVLRGFPDIGEAGKPDEAIPLITDAIDSNPENYHAYAARASAYQRTKDLQLALNDINHAIELTKQRPEHSYYIQRAYVQRAMHNYSAALEDCNRALQIATGDYDLSNVLLSQGC